MKEICRMFITAMNIVSYIKSQIKNVIFVKSLLMFPASSGPGTTPSGSV